ncbi:MAG TPA: ATP-binding protein [Thermoanaerobaculia bacterium]|nr:ATP-binding protein [Thermoanaerobaculia bacterium]
MTEHAVQFYERDDFLCDRVAHFVAEGLGAGEPALIIATDDHRGAVLAQLRGRGCDLGRVTFFDARETLEKFMSGAMPDEQKFYAIIGDAVSRRANGGGRIRAYGEMVDLLWRDGKPDAAIRLEELWNGLANHHDFSLLCAYPMSNFLREADAGAFQDICATHSHVIPTEAYTGAMDDEARLREISILQQRSGALDSEVMRRRKLEHELQDFIENAAVGLHWVGPEGTILWANHAELRLLGYSAGEYIGRNIAEFHADRPAIADILERLSRGENVYDYEARLIAKDGSIRHVAISSNVLFDNGKFVHTRCFTRDITDRKRLEEANAFLAEASSTLNRSLDYDSRIHEIANLIVPQLADSCTIDVLAEEDAPLASEPWITDGGARMTVPMNLPDRGVGSITFLSETPGRYTAADLPLASEFVRRCAVALENARLYRLAQQANRTKDEFLATLSHELRTPLTAILGWARMLTLGGIDDATRKAAYDTIERSARTQATLIDDLLDLSRVVTGKLTLQNELVDLESIVRSAVQTLQLAADAKGISFDVSLSEERAAVNGDPTRLQQIVWNLLSNAIKFTDAGAHVSVGLTRDSELARITVRDEGKGISPEFLPHVFEAFRQADGASTRKHGGLGLGLAIVKYLTELHGGSVIAHSAGEGRGATFTVTLPLAVRRWQD